MQIFGLDFTSAPRKHKPITLAGGILHDDVLTIDHLTGLESWVAFEGWLRTPGTWVAGLDFPFGQSRRFIENVGWPLSWAAYVRVIATMQMQDFLDVLKAYRDSRPPGDKHHLRHTDELANAISPMMVYGVPVGRMFFRGAPRLLEAGVSIEPCHPTNSSKVVLETYPKLVATWATSVSYKSDDPRKQQADYVLARKDIVSKFRSDALVARYGFRVALSDIMAQTLVDEPMGDYLDAVLCAIEAAWASRQAQYGVPPDADPLEGWIVRCDR